MSGPVAHAQRVSSYHAVITTPCKPIYARRWERFWTEIMTDFVPEAHRKCYASSATRRGQALRYYEAVFERADAIRATNKNATEEHITSECFDHLVRFPNQVWEETGNKINDYSKSTMKQGTYSYKADKNATKLKNVAFLRSPGEVGDRYDMICRVPATLSDFPTVGIHNINADYDEDSNTLLVGDEEGLCPYIKDGVPVLPFTPEDQAPPLLSTALPRDRAFPLNVQSILELKRFVVALGKLTVEQLAHYLECLLRVTPGRRFAFGVATNMQQLVFVAVIATYTDDGQVRYRHLHSRTSKRHQAPIELSKFCGMVPEAMGLDTAYFHSPDFRIMSFLGRGSTGAVVQCRWKNVDIALKISIMQRELALERILLNFLRIRNVEWVPRIHGAAQEILFPRFKNSCTAFHVLAPLGKVKKIDILQVWDILRSLHAVGIVHRDIRAANMMRDGLGHMYLIDFSAAQFYDHALAGGGLETALGRPLAEVEELYSPCNVNTTSTAVLRDNLPTLPADEACAVIYAALAMRHYDLNAHWILNTNTEIAEYIVTRNRWPRMFRGTSGEHAANIATALENLHNNRNLAGTDLDNVVRAAIQSVFNLPTTEDVWKG